MMPDEAMPGPVDFVLIEFPTDSSMSSTADALSDLVDSGIVRLYDIVLIRKAADGRSNRLDLTAPLNGARSGFERFAGAQSGLFDDEDVRQSAEALEPDTTALLIAFENAWASPFVTAAHAAGGQVVASERIPAHVLIETLAAAEEAS